MKVTDDIPVTDAESVASLTVNNIGSVFTLKVALIWEPYLKRFDKVVFMTRKTFIAPFEP